MSQQNDTGTAAVLRQNTFSLNPSPVQASPELAIFSAPGVEAVLLWWLESNRRWTERNGTDGLIPPGAVGQDGPA
jgi:hypothetical protein